MTINQNIELNKILLIFPFPLLIVPSMKFPSNVTEAQNHESTSGMFLFRGYQNMLDGQINLPVFSFLSQFHVFHHGRRICVLLLVLMQLECKCWVCQ